MPILKNYWFSTSFETFVKTTVNERKNNGAKFATKHSVPLHNTKVFEKV